MSIGKSDGRNASTTRDTVFNASLHLLERSFRGLPFDTAAEGFSSGCPIPLIRNGLDQYGDLHFVHLASDDQTITTLV